MTTMATVRRRQGGEHEESYFVSMTDMMVGLVFVLMVMLVYYALQYRQTTVELTDTKVRRTQLLQSLQTQLKSQNVNVVVDIDSGVLRLPEDVLFDKGKRRGQARGRGGASQGRAGAARQGALLHRRPSRARLPRDPGGPGVGLRGGPHRR